MMQFEEVGLLGMLALLLCVGLAQLAFLLFVWAFRRRLSRAIDAHVELEAQAAARRDRALGVEDTDSVFVLIAVHEWFGDASYEITQEWVNEYLSSVSRDRCEKKFDDVCSICLEDFTDSYSERRFTPVNCSHIFHLECIGKWVFVGRDASCPNCKNVLIPACRDIV